LTKKQNKPKQNKEKTLKVFCFSRASERLIDDDDGERLIDDGERLIDDGFLKKSRRFVVFTDGERGG
jgi:hypothetical protein